MKAIKVKSLYLGLVGLPDFKVAEAVAAGHALHFIRGNEEMVVPFVDIARRQMGRSPKPFTDKFRKRPPYYLCYFKWEPSVTHPTLL